MCMPTLRITQAGNWARRGQRQITHPIWHCGVRCSLHGRLEQVKNAQASRVGDLAARVYRPQLLSHFPLDLGHGGRRTSRCH